MNGKLVKIDVLTDSNDRPNFGNVTEIDPFETYGIENYSFGIIATSADMTLDVFTAPIGVAFMGTFNAGAWKLSPMVDLSIVPSFGDDEATSTVSWRNVEDEVKTQVVDVAPFRASLNLNAEMGGWTVGASYDLGVGGGDRLDNAFTFKARY